MLKINKKILLVLTIAYIYLPVAVFLFGFTKLYIAAISVAAIAFFVIGMYKDYSNEEEKDTNIQIKWWCGALVGVVILGICFIAGFGEFTPLAGDWWKHNAVIADLTLYDWPVYYTEGEKSMLTYYLGQYLIPTLIGKTCGGNIRISVTAMGIWGVLGVVLVYLNLIKITVSKTSKEQLRAAYIMFFFCGALLLVQTILGGIYKEDSYSAGSYHWVLVKSIMLQYRSNFVMLRWVYPQIIVPWLITMLFMENREKTKHFVLLISPVLLYGTFSVVYLSFAALVCAIYKVIISDDKKIEIKNVFSLSNIVIFCTFGLVMIFYYLGYMQVKKPVFSSFTIANYTLGTIPVYLIFCLLMYGVYGICVYKEQQNNILYYVMISALTIIPSFRMGLCNDWVMSSSIPALFMLMIYVIITFNEKKDTRQYGIRSAVLAMFILIGSWYPFMEIKDTLTDYVPDDYSNWTYYTMEDFSDRSLEDVTEDLIYNYYTYDLDGKIFYEYIAKNKIIQ